MRGGCGLAVTALLLNVAAISVTTSARANDFSEEVLVGDVTIGIVQEGVTTVSRRHGILSYIAEIIDGEVVLNPSLVSLTVIGRPSAQPVASESALPWEEAEPVLARVLAAHDSLQPVVPGKEYDVIGPSGETMVLPDGLATSARLASLGWFDDLVARRSVRRALFKEAALRAVALDEAQRFDQTLDAALASSSGATAMLGATASVSSAGLNTYEQLRIISDAAKAAEHGSSTAGIASKVSSRVSASGLGKAVEALGILAYGVELAMGFADAAARNRVLGQAAEDALVILALEDARRLLQATDADPAMIDGLQDAIAEVTTMSKSRLERFADAARKAVTGSVPTLVGLIASSVLKGASGAVLVVQQAAELAEELGGYAHAVMVVAALTTLGADLRGPIEGLVYDGEFKGALAGDYAIRELVGLHDRLSAEATASVYNMLWTDRWADVTSLAGIGRGLGLTIAEWRTGSEQSEEDYKAEAEWRVGQVRKNAAFNARLPEILQELAEFYTVQPAKEAGSDGGGIGIEGLEFVWVPPGDFRMGSTNSEASGDEQPVTQARISSGFWLGKYEVTQAQWYAVMRSNPSEFRGCDRCPVERVSWDDVQGFIRKLNQLEGLQGMGFRYRLPTEAEWEYAARAAGTSGERYGPGLDAIAWHRGNSENRTHPVGEKAPNALGLHDMLGNVQEWVQDRYGPYPGGTVTDPTGSGTGTHRATRGGSWISIAKDCRAADRRSQPPGSRIFSLGLRLVRTQPTDVGTGTGSGVGEGDRNVLTGPGALEIGSASVACGREDPWRACYHRTEGEREEPLQLSVSMPREPAETWHVGWCRKRDRQGLCDGRYDWSVFIAETVAAVEPLAVQLTPLSDTSRFWAVVEVRKCGKAPCVFPADYSEVEFHHIEVTLPLTDRQALEAFHDSTGGPRWTNSANWKTAAPLGDWYGVTTDAGGRVTGLDLRGNGLSGTIPAELSSLNQLESLELQDNELDGRIPSGLGRLQRLQLLDLGRNTLTGAIPDTLGKLASLQRLFLNNNELTGPAPAELGNLTSLEWLFVNNNGLVGALPSSLTKLQRLSDFGFSSNAGLCAPSTSSFQTWLLGIANRNGLTCGAETDRQALEALYDANGGAGWHRGTNWKTDAPLAEWHGVTTDADGRVTGLDLRANGLTGAVSAALTSLTRLERLELQENLLTGGIPSALGNLARLERLHLQKNALAGPIPPALGNLAALEYLALNENGLVGTVPPELGNLTALQGLWLWGNALTGELPSSLTTLRQIETFRFHSNNGLCSPSSEQFRVWLRGISSVEGTECGAEADRRVLEAVYDTTGGAGWKYTTNWKTAAALGEWHGVTTNAGGRVTGLDLHDNGLTGRIPAGLGDLTQLEKLELHENALSGNIPPALGNLTRLKRLHLQKNALSGTIPATLGNLAELEYLSLNENALTGTIPDELGNLTHLQGLWAWGNALTGELPLSLTHLRRLETLRFHGNDGLCAPITEEFQTWLRGISAVEGPRCDSAETDRQALEVFFDATGGARWTNSTNWKTDAPLNEWHGVTTDVGGRVNSLNIAQNKLSGTIPAELASLARLSALILSDNKLSGTIPAELGQLTNLGSLDLGRNALDGPVPAALGSLANLESLSLSGNFLSGPIPPSLGNLANLESLSLSWNALSGSVPAELGNLASLRDLILDSNELTGTLPSKLTQLRRLQRFRFEGNAGLCAPTGSAFQDWLAGIADSQGPTCFSGSPATDREALEALYDAAGGEQWANSTNWKTEAPLGQWHGVKTDARGRVIELLLHENQLMGTVAPELGRLTHLVWLGLSGDRDESLHGPIPPELGNLTRLRGLSLWGNQLEGHIPPELGRLTNLELLFLGDNRLRGTIPPELGRLRKLRELQLHRNSIRGSIPPELGRLTNLEVLSLGGNALGGSIPPELGNLTRLRELYLWGNRLQGEIPSELGRLTNLEVLYVIRNELQGYIPASLTNLRKLKRLRYEENYMNLCVPRIRVFDEWLAGIEEVEGARCWPPSNPDNPGPEVVASIPSQTLTLGAPPTRLSMGQFFRHPDGEQLYYRYSGEIFFPSIEIEASGETVLLKPLKAGTDRVTVTATDPYREEVSQTFEVTVTERPRNQPPTTPRPIPSQTLTVGDPTERLPMGQFFRDPDGDRLTYSTAETPAGVVTARVSGANLLLTAVAAGTARVTVTARDQGGLEASQRFTVTVRPRRVNEPPIATRRIPPVELTVGGDEKVLHLPDYFQDPERQKLDFLSSTTPNGVVIAEVHGLNADFLLLDPVAAGTAKVTVTARDPGGLEATQTIDVTVKSSDIGQPGSGQTDGSGPHGMEFVRIPAGEFLMGSNSSLAKFDEQPITQVRISREFWLGKYEVTQEQWQAVMGTNPSRFSVCGRCPVERVSWNDVQDFIRKLNERERGTGYVYRLPTEAEWEYAARAGTTGDRYAQDVDKIAWHVANSGLSTYSVGQKEPNAWGLHDMLGNVWEWVQDWYGPYPGGSVTDPAGPSSGSHRVLRGAGWANPASRCRAPERYREPPTFSQGVEGFRLVRTR